MGLPGRLDREDKKAGTRGVEICNLFQRVNPLENIFLLDLREHNIPAQIFWGVTNQVYEWAARIVSSSAFLRSWKSYTIRGDAVEDVEREAGPKT